MIHSQKIIWRRRLFDYIKTKIGYGPTMLEPLEAYQRWASTYDDQNDNALFYAEQSALYPILEQSSLTGKNILDAGCGTGRYIDLMSRFRPDAIDGIDVSARMIEVAKAKFQHDPTISLRIADIVSLPYPDNSFDFILSTLMLDHLSHLRDGIQELARVLCPHGSLVISVYHPNGEQLGWKRTFRTANEKEHLYAVKYYGHKLHEYISAFRSFNLKVAQIVEPVIDEYLEPYFRKAGRTDLYDRFKGYPLLLIIRITKP